MERFYLLFVSNLEMIELVINDEIGCRDEEYYMENGGSALQHETADGVALMTDKFSDRRR